MDESATATFGHLNLILDGQSLAAPAAGKPDQGETVMDNFVMWVTATTVSILAWWAYREYFQKVPLFELEEQKSVLRTAEWLPDSDQTELFAKGIRGITRHEWKTIKRRAEKEVSRHLGAQNLTPAAWASLNSQLRK
jgi:hypothetical protein